MIFGPSSVIAAWVDKGWQGQDDDAMLHQGDVPSDELDTVFVHTWETDKLTISSSQSSQAWRAAQIHTDNRQVPLLAQPHTDPLCYHPANKAPNHQHGSLDSINTTPCSLAAIMNDEIQMAGVSDLLTMSSDLLHIHHTTKSAGRPLPSVRPRLCRPHRLVGRQKTRRLHVLGVDCPCELSTSQSWANLRQRRDIG